MVGMREKIPRDKLDQFGAKYITALRTIEDKGAAAS
jgi:hypothetical protein